MRVEQIPPKALELLQKIYLDGKKTTQELADLCGITRQTAAKIRKALWIKGIINRPAIIINPKFPSFNMLLIEVKTNPSEPAVLSQLRNFRDIVSLDGILGEYSLICRFHSLETTAKSDIILMIDSTLSKNSVFQSYRLIDVLDTYKMGGFQIPRNISPESISVKKKQNLSLFRINYNPIRWKSLDRNQKWNRDLKILNADENHQRDSLNFSRELGEMEEKKIILHFSCVINAKYLPRQMKFYLRIQPELLSGYEKLAIILSNREEITDLFRTGEEYGLLAIVRTTSLENYDKFIQEIYQSGEIKNSHTTVCIREVIPWISPCN